MRILWPALVVFVLDQISKIAIVFGLDLKTVGEIDVLPPYLVFRMAWNQGVNFGLFAHHSDVVRWVLIVLALGISGWVWRWIAKGGQPPLAQVSAGILIGGALGNVVDRVLYGAVADFLNMSCCGIENPFSFNIADIAVFAGAIGLVLFAREAGAKPRKTP